MSGVQVAWKVVDSMLFLAVSFPGTFRLVYTLGCDAMRCFLITAISATSACEEDP